MSLFKGILDAGNKFTAQDTIAGLEILKTYDSVGPKAAYIQLEDSTGVDNYIWFDDNQNLRHHTSPPTGTTDDGGSVLSGVTNAQANPALSNLASVAINTSIQSDSDLGDDCGDASYQWQSLYARDLYLNSTATMKGSTGGQIDVVGKFYVGTNSGAAAYDVIFYGYTAGQWMWWDENYNSNAGGLLLGDNVSFALGTGYDIEFVSNGTDLKINARADNVKIHSGIDQDIDWIWESKTSTSTEDHMGWIADLYTLQLSGKTKLHFGGADIDTIDDGFVIAFDDSNTLNIDPYTGHINDIVRIGESVVADFYLDGAATDLIWDCSVDELVFNDSTKLVFGGAGTGADDLVIYSDGTLVQMKMSGSGSTTTSGIVITPYAAATVAAVHIDGATTDWDGASNVGMLHLSSNTALNHAGASNLVVIHASTQPIDDADGFLARFVSTGTARTNAFAVDIAVPATQPALRLDGIFEITGQNNVGAALVQITGNNSSADTVAVDIHNEGTAAALLLTGDDTDSLELKVVCKASQTTSAAIIDGAAGAFIGAEDVGMLHLAHATTELAHVDSTLLRVESTRQPKTSAMGYLARFEGEGTARGGASAVAITAKDSTEYALNITAGMVNITDHVYAQQYLYNVVTRTANNGGDGSAIAAVGEGFLQIDTTTSDDADILTLPAALAGMVIYIYNVDGTYDFILEGNASETINGAANVTLGEDDMLHMICVEDGKWIAVQLAANGTPTAAS